MCVGSVMAAGAARRGIGHLWPARAPGRRWSARRHRGVGVDRRSREGDHAKAITLRRSERFVPSRLDHGRARVVDHRDAAEPPGLTVRERLDDFSTRVHHEGSHPGHRLPIGRPPSRMSRFALRLSWAIEAPRVSASPGPKTASWLAGKGARPIRCRRDRRVRRRAWVVGPSGHRKSRTRAQGRVHKSHRRVCRVVAGVPGHFAGDHAHQCSSVARG
ncbi:hypothetical protein BH20CHL6_BH20CHL6_03850 [soil metagenome]